MQSERLITNTDSEISAPRRAGPPEDLTGLRARLVYGAVLSGLFCLLVWPVILSGSLREDKTGAASDQEVYHLPVIMKMAKAWPHVDLNDVGGAQMAPTYHCVLAAISHYGNVGVTGLRMVNSLSGLALLLSVFWYASRWVDSRTAFMLAVTYLFSPIMLGCAMWLMTADIALFFVVVSLACAALFPPTPKWMIGSGLAAAGATAVRQIHIWLAGPILAVPLCELLQRRFPFLAWPGPGKSRGFARLIVPAGLAVAMPMAALLFYVIRWHGLLPPNAVAPGVHNRGTIVPLALAQAGFCCFFLVPAAIERPLQFIRDWRVWAGAAAFLIVAAIPATGRSTDPAGVLRQFSHTPMFFGRLLIFLPPAALGGAGFAMLMITLANRDMLRPALIVLVGFLAWLSAHSVTAYALRHYCDIIQIMIIFLVSLALPAGPRLARFWIWTGAFALTHLALDVYQIYYPVLHG